jgi:hypothetical protein
MAGLQQRQEQAYIYKETVSNLTATIRLLSATFPANE